VSDRAAVPRGRASRTVAPDSPNGEDPGARTTLARMRDVLLYSVLRLIVLLVAWWLLVLIGVGFFLAGIIAVLIAFLISVLFLRAPRERIAGRLQSADERRRARRGPVHDEDADEEDALLDETEDADEEDALLDETEDADEEDALLDDTESEDAAPDRSEDASREQREER
jgi:hypothetical protein